MISEREEEVLKLTADGLSCKEIGERLFISEATVKRHKSNVIRRLGAENMINAVAIALREGMIK